MSEVLTTDQKVLFLGTYLFSSYPMTAQGRSQNLIAFYKGSWGGFYSVRSDPKQAWAQFGYFFLSHFAE